MHHTSSQMMMVQLIGRYPYHRIKQHHVASLRVAHSKHSYSSGVQLSRNAKCNFLAEVALKCPNQVSSTPKMNDDGSIGEGASFLSCTFRDRWYMVMQKSTNKNPSMIWAQKAEEVDNTRVYWISTTKMWFGCTKKSARVVHVGYLRFCVQNTSGFKPVYLSLFTFSWMLEIRIHLPNEKNMFRADLCITL